MPVSDTFLALESGGIIHREPRRAPLPPLAAEVAERMWEPAGDSRRVNALLRRASLAGDLELAGMPPEGLEEVCDLAAALYLNRVHDALEIAGAMGLAPVAHSPLSNFGSLLGSSEADVPRREAALIAATIETFAIHPETSVEQVLRFRADHSAALGRLRASLGDLAANLSESQPPRRLVWQARDIYRNRVIPALSQLEDALNESRVRFAVRSLVGATAIAMAPMAPIGVADKGLVLVGKTLDYRFSRKRLIDQHPFSYLHLVSEHFDSAPPDGWARDLGRVLKSPEDAIRSMMLRGISPLVIMSSCACCDLGRAPSLPWVVEAARSGDWRPVAVKSAGAFGAVNGTRTKRKDPARNMRHRGR